MRRRVLPILVLIALLGGCIAAPASDDAPTADDDLDRSGDNETPQDDARGGAQDPDGGDGEPSGPGDNGTAPPEDTGEPRDNGTAPPEPAPPQWAAPEDAKIRPGVRITMGGRACTANFVFTSPDYATVYLGTAAHCVNGLDNPTVDIAGGAAKGTVAYDSFAVMDAKDVENDHNDFALIELRPEDHDLVSPALLRYGGPTAMAGDVTVGDRVLTYGNTPMRGGVDAVNAREGYVTATSEWSTTVLTVTPGIPGDSGSAVITADGEALGILVTLHIAPVPGQNGVTSLDAALAFAREHAGIDARLATWDSLDGGMLPGV